MPSHVRTLHVASLQCCWRVGLAAEFKMWAALRNAAVGNAGDRALWLADRRVLIVLIAAVVITPLCMPRDLNALEWVSSPPPPPTPKGATSECSLHGGNLPRWSASQA